MGLQSRFWPRLGHLLVMTLCSACSVNVAAQQADTEESGPTTSDSTSFMLLLEFIGEFTDEQGEWIDPIELEQELSAEDAADPESDKLNKEAD